MGDIGATSKSGRSHRMAHTGTLFLDEVGDMPLALQPKLLRVLQEQEFERVGGTRTHSVNVRVVAATNRDFAQMVQRGEFRSDLYYRLNVFPLRLPPLHQRRDDIVPLVHYFVDKYSRRIGRKIDLLPPETLHAIVSYDWPGNIRELQNAIERVVILSCNGILLNPLENDPEKDREVGVSVLPAKNRESTLRRSLDGAERNLILNALRESSWIIGGTNGAAARLGVKRTSLIYRIRRLGILKPDEVMTHAE